MMVEDGRSANRYNVIPESSTFALGLDVSAFHDPLFIAAIESCFFFSYIRLDYLCECVISSTLAVIPLCNLSFTPKTRQLHPITN